MRVDRWILVALVALAALLGMRSIRSRFAGPGSTRAAAPASYPESALRVRAPDSVRITVEVLNATRTRGLARRATLYLRDRGFDVVLTSTSRLQSDRTLVLDRSRKPDAARLVARAMNAPVQERPDSLRYLDVTVVVGADWTPPREPFYP